MRYTRFQDPYEGIDRTIVAEAQKSVPGRLWSTILSGIGLILAGIASLGGLSILSYYEYFSFDGNDPSFIGFLLYAGVLVVSIAIAIPFFIKHMKREDKVMDKIKELQDAG